LINLHLLTAYRATTYFVAAPGRTLALRIDQHDAQLATLLQETGADCAALLTAWNAGSQKLSPAENAIRQQSLLHDLAAGGFHCLPGTNVPDPGEHSQMWSEDSVLVLNLSLSAARELAGRHGQNAFLWMDRHATPQLIVTGEDVPVSDGR
jgi:hypothetical protein